MPAVDPVGASEPDASERYALLRALDAGAVPAFAARTNDGANQLVVVESVSRSGEFHQEEVADYVRDAKRVAELDHPNVGRIRDVVIQAQSVLVVSELVDGERLEDVFALGAQGKLPLEISLRILVDVLTGLGAIHNLRDARKMPLKLLHGELTPANVVVGADGLARVVHTCRVRKGARRIRANGYLAPEVLLGDAEADQRADLYSVGSMLWEALVGRPLFSDPAPGLIVSRLLSGRLPPATPPANAPWAAPLTEVVTRALAADPGARFPNAAAMAAELRRVAGARLASGARVAAFLKAAFGDRIAKRRATLSSAPPMPPVEDPHSRPTAPPPGPHPGAVPSASSAEAASARPRSEPPPEPSGDEAGPPSSSIAIEVHEDSVLPSPPAPALRPVAPPPKVATVPPPKAEQAVLAAAAPPVIAPLGAPTPPAAAPVAPNRPATPPDRSTVGVVATLDRDSGERLATPQRRRAGIALAAAAAVVLLIGVLVVVRVATSRPERSAGEGPRRPAATSTAPLDGTQLESTSMAVRAATPSAPTAALAETHATPGSAPAAAETAGAPGGAPALVPATIPTGTAPAPSATTRPQPRPRLYEPQGI